MRAFLRRSPQVGGSISPMFTFRYPALKLQQTEESKPLVLFAASATEIEQWAGVPQRRRLSGEETVGWQREENPERLRELTRFFSDGRNVVQNPLLGAVQDGRSVRFEPAGNDGFGYLVIQGEDPSQWKLLKMLQKVCQRLQERVPSLAESEVPKARLRRAMDLARETHGLEFAETPDGEDEEALPDELDEESEGEMAEEPSEAASAVFDEETQILDFYRELQVRIEILEQLGQGADPDSILGFTRDAMLGYLKPVVLVDGQHRLRGAVRAAREILNSEEGQEAQARAIDEGQSPEEATSEVLQRVARALPFSLLLDDSPKEHVFQFVVVNQKATPMGRALLGTIVSTSLAKNELEAVADRLRRAGIPLDDAQAVAYLTRAEASPFVGLVQTGVSGDDSSHLQWTVLKGLTTIFRELRGGRLYGQNNDYADIWRRKHLNESALVAEGADAEEKYRLWSSPGGPWRAVFMRFYTLVRDHFGDPNDMNAPNAWGNTDSNLFNKISLTILAADYFQFLCERQLSLNSVDDVDTTVAEWLEGTDSRYFSRDWGLTSIKKDQTAVRNKWAATWSEYRKNPVRLPRKENYRP
jgi:hypothetical protein